MAKKKLYPAFMGFNMSVPMLLQVREIQRQLGEVKSEAPSVAETMRYLVSRALDDIASTDGGKV